MNINRNNNNNSKKKKNLNLTPIACTILTQHKKNYKEQNLIRRHIESLNSIIKKRKKRNRMKKKNYFITTLFLSWFSGRYQSKKL